MKGLANYNDDNYLSFFHIIPKLKKMHTTKKVIIFELLRYTPAEEVYTN